MNNGCRPETPYGVKVIEVIETHCGRGLGTIDDTYRHVAQYWTKDGHLLAESDPVYGAELEKAKQSLIIAGYTDEGGELWRPPLGKRPDSMDLTDLEWAFINQFRKLKPGEVVEFVTKKP